MRSARTAWFCLLASGAHSLSNARPALADDRAPVPVVVRANRGGWQLQPAVDETDCRGACSYALRPGAYTFRAPNVEQQIEVRGPATTITYRAEASPALRTAGWAAVLGGLTVGGLALYGGLKLCATTTKTNDSGYTYDSRPCEGGAYGDRNQGLQYTLLGVSGVGFAAAFVGAFVIAFSSPWVGVDYGLPARPKGSTTFGAGPIDGGAALRAVTRF